MEANTANAVAVLMACAVICEGSDGREWLGRAAARLMPEFLFAFGHRRGAFCFAVRFPVEREEAE